MKTPYIVIEHYVEFFVYCCLAEDEEEALALYFQHQWGEEKPSSLFPYGIVVKKVDVSVGNFDMLFSLHSDNGLFAPEKIAHMHRLLSSYYEDNEMLSDAIIEREMCVRMTPPNTNLPDDLLTMARLYREEGSPRKAINCYKAALAIPEAHDLYEQLHSLLSSLYKEMGKKTQADKHHRLMEQLMEEQEEED